MRASSFGTNTRKLLCMYKKTTALDVLESERAELGATERTTRNHRRGGSEDSR